MNEKYPNQYLLPAIGNNDPKWHNEFAQDEADDYYTFLFDLWFTNHPVNSRYPMLTEVEQTFKLGGFYKLIVNQTVFIVMNSLYFDNDSAHLDHKGIDEYQLNWLD